MLDTRIISWPRYSPEICIGPTHTWSAQCLAGNKADRTVVWNQVPEPSGNGDRFSWISWELGWSGATNGPVPTGGPPYATIYGQDGKILTHNTANRPLRHGSGPEILHRNPIGASRPFIRSYPHQGPDVFSPLKCQLPSHSRFKNLRRPSVNGHNVQSSLSHMFGASSWSLNRQVGQTLGQTLLHNARQDRRSSNILPLKLPSGVLIDFRGVATR